MISIQKYKAEESWRVAIKSKNYLITLGITAVLSSFSAKLISDYFQVIEGRAGIEVYDPVLAYVGPFYLNDWIQFLTLFAMAIGLSLQIIRPRNLLRLLLAVIMLNIFRMSTLFLVPLDPPSTIIPLREAFTEYMFYQNNVITKDLFFSGHTANVFLLALLSTYKTCRYILFGLTVVIGTMLILQHVHYSYDVIAAPFFTYAAYWIAVRVADVLQPKAA